MSRQSLATQQQRRLGARHVIEGRREAIEAMNTALQRKFVQIEQRIHSLQEDNLRYYHTFGQALLDVQAQPEIYERNALRLLERALAVNARLLRRAAAFAREYTADDLERLLALRNEDAGFRLHFGHVTYLLGVPTPAARWQYAQRAVDGLWDPLYLHKQIQKRYGTTNPHGATHRCPGTVANQIRQIMEVCRIWLAKQQTVWNGQGANSSNVFANICDAPPEQFTADDIANLRSAREFMSLIAEEAGGNLGKLDRGIEYAEACLAAQAAQAAEAAAAEPRAEPQAQATPRRGGGRPARLITVAPPETRARGAASRASAAG